MIYEFEGDLFPEYIKDGNASGFIQPVALAFCQGKGLDIGAGQWPLPGATPIDISSGGDAMALPEGENDFVFSSHCLEHLADPVAAIEHWKTRLKTDGTLFLHLPHPSMTYWRPQYNRKHKHLFWPLDTSEMVRSLGFYNVINSERDMYWSFSVVGFKR